MATLPPHVVQAEALIARAIVGHGRWSTMPTTAEGAVARLTGMVGKKGEPLSVSAAARHYGVPRRTWRRWASGETKTIPAPLAMVIRRAQLSAAREARLRAAGARGGNGGVRLTQAQTIAYGYPDRHPRAVMRIGRAVAAKPANAINTNAVLIDAFLTGKQGEMWEALQEVAHAYVPDMTIESIKGISLE